MVQPLGGAVGPSVVSLQFSGRHCLSFTDTALGRGGAITDEEEPQEKRDRPKAL